MRIHQVVIVPSAGWSGDEGQYSRGHEIGWTSEVDLVDAYVSYIADTLDQEGVRHEVMGTRKRPGVRSGERAKAVTVNSLVLHCAVGWHKNHEKVILESNISRVYYNLSVSWELARNIAETIGQWGELTVHGHRAGKAMQDQKDELLVPPGSQGIRLEPLIINGPSVKDYAQHMARLGKDIGNTVATYCREVGQGVMQRTAVIR